jgi:hypothetical protein
MNHYLVLFSGTAVAHADGKSLGRWWRFSLPKYLDPNQTNTVLLDVISQVARTSFFCIDEVLDITDPANPKSVHIRV